MDVINTLVVQLFSVPNVGLYLAGAIVASCFFIIIWTIIRHYLPFALRLQSRLRITKFIANTKSTEEAQIAFAANFDLVDSAMLKGGPADDLRHAWIQFRDTIVNPVEVPLRSTTRPEDFFLHFGSNTRILAWWANIFVAVGIICTFLGIIAALLMAVNAMQSSADTTNMQRALVQLLTITAAKFWTSVAGVGSSIILRLADRVCHSRTLRKLSLVCARIERGMLFSPLQRIAVDQLHEIREQTVALRDFSTKLAVAIGEQLENRMQPMVSVLGNIQNSIDDFKTGTFGQIGKELGEAISRSAGSEMHALAAALTTMTSSIGAVNEKVEASGQQASEQIAIAAREFSTAAELMARTFASARDGIEGMSGRLTEQADAAATRNAHVLSSTTAALEAMISSTSAGLGNAVSKAITTASEESGKVMSSAFAAFGENFDKAGLRLVETVQNTASRMESLASSIERSTLASNDHAGKLESASQGIQEVSGKLSRAASDVQIAAAPMRDATVTIGNSLTKMQDILRAVGETSAENESAVRTVTTSFSQTSEAATRAWADYHRRFEDVDKALAAALDQINSASGEHARTVMVQIGEMDKHLADAVDRLAVALGPLSELASELEDVHRRMIAAE